jgi:hypothetical protein
MTVEGNIGYSLRLKHTDKATIKKTVEEALELVQLSGTALFPGDIAPELDTIGAGTVTVFGETRRIFRGTKARNPDGTVNYCRLDLI